MKTIKYNVQKKSLFLFGFFAISLAALCYAGSSTEDRIFKYYKVDINLFSIDPAQSLDTYIKHGGGSTGGGNVGLGYCDSTRNFRVNTNVRKDQKRFLVSVGIVPGKNDSKTKKESYELDLTDLKPKSLELAILDNGRTCILNLTPSVEIIDNRPKRADDSAFEFSRWALQDSMVIFNDSVYAGQLGCTGGPLAYVSYPGYAKVEFALVPFQDAKLLGMLKDGRIQINSEDGQTLDIYGVKNGVHEIQLPGGPYEIWARWESLPPSEEEFKIPSKEEWIDMVKAKFSEMGNTPPSNQELDSSYEKLKYEKHIPLSSGVGPIRDVDRID